MAVPEWQNTLHLQLDLPGLTGTVASEKKLNTGSENGERGRGERERVGGRGDSSLEPAEEVPYTRSLL